MADNTNTVLTGRCYCGAITFTATQKPQVVAYCHCESCRRATGGVAAAFAAMDEEAVVFKPNEGRIVSLTPEVSRKFCADCGSSLTGRYAYLPGQVYLSVGVIDQAADLAPQIHAHDAERLPWLHIDDLERLAATARSKINSSPK
ncbi:hypothetical protein AB833_31560 [Chromatiales bacterium (ex Bugula neritina AB1)]|nr:hypothetical protein AB833_31560 [Chromatiales bacterium (ex Bugula neritina AB1)]